MAEERNVLGGRLEPCSVEPRTGFYRDGCCNTGPEDLGLHVDLRADDRGVPRLFSRARQRPVHAAAGSRLPGIEAGRPLVHLRRTLARSARRRRSATGGAFGDARRRPSRSSRWRICSAMRSIPTKARRARWTWRTQPSASSWSRSRSFEAAGAVLSRRPRSATSVFGAAATGFFQRDRHRLLMGAPAAGQTAHRGAQSIFIRRKSTARFEVNRGGISRPVAHRLALCRASSCRWMDEFT